MGLIRRFTRLSPHLRLALILTPLLGLGGYLLAGLFTPAPDAPADDRPRAIEPAGPCRLRGGVCRLLHREIAVNLGTPADDPGLLYLATSVPIEGALVSLDDAPPQPMQRRDNAKHWQLRLAHPPGLGSRLRLALATDQHRYYAELTVSADGS